MAYIYDEPLNNRSGIGGKEEMERKDAVRAMDEQEERHEHVEAEKVAEERAEDKAEAASEKKALEERMH